MPAFVMIQGPATLFCQHRDTHYYMTGGDCGEIGDCCGGKSAHALFCTALMLGTFLFLGEREKNQWTVFDEHSSVDEHAT